jgi:hypothetical protein
MLFFVLLSLLLIIVPVFDGRLEVHQIELPGGLRNVPQSRMPLFNRPIPQDAIVLIGYSTAAYEANRHPGDKTVSLNIVWVVVLACEDP